ncbi:MAG: exodeoxyribonuclease VII large subunit [Bacilli bacterium]
MNDKYLTVSELNSYIKNIIDNEEFLRRIYLKGEISNFKAHTRGHFYFSLKDENSKINAIMFMGNTKKVLFNPEEGMKVLVTGKISVYEPTGNYQIYVEDMLEDGVGNLYIAFNQLKEKLEKEGLFDPIHKKRIPKIPNRIGIITASTGAAIRDILTTIKRRYPLCKTILFPSLVQGDKAKDDIVRQIKRAESYNLDLLIVGRGGGSIEDLWPFNEEIVAKAIYNSSIPIISAVGHEIDFTISDFVADLRAPTPTAAAELAVPNMIDIINYIDQVKIRLNQTMKKKIEFNKMLFDKLINTYVLKKPLAMYEIKEQKLDNLIDRLGVNIKAIFDINKNTYINLLNKLEVLNPLSVLKRGYTVIKMKNKAISNVDKLNKDDLIDINFKDGIVNAKILEIKEVK